MESILRKKSFDFAIHIIKLCQFLQVEKKEFVLSRQLLKSGTAIGALLNEAQFGQSRADFLSKLNIALKEANESLYWLELLKATNYIDEEFERLYNECNELVAMLVSSTKTLKHSSQ